MDRSGGGQGGALLPRLAAAFSLRRNLTKLFVPAPGHLSPLDGLRALSILWVTLFHAVFYSVWYVTPEAYQSLVGSPYNILFWRGDFGVDVFFVLSGFLIARMLLDERDKTGKVHLGIFQARRFLRTWPTLAAVVAFDVLVFHENPDVAWMDLVYATNFASVAHVCLGWTWSLSIEEQFYVTCPWILRGIHPFPLAGRVAAMAILTLACAAATASVVSHGGFHVFDAEPALNRPLDRWILAFDALYTKPWTRVGPILAGITAALLHRDPRFWDRWSASRVAAPLAFAIALPCGALATHWQLFLGAPRPVEVAYLALYRPVFGAATATLTLFCLSAHPLGRFLGRLLSTRWLYPISQLSFAAYLVNPVVTTMVHRYLALPILFRGLPPLPFFMPLDIVGTFLVATVLHLVIERPGLELRPRTPSTP